ncbi:cytochrome c oxidase subunit 4 [Brachybacterium sp. GCM10030267]|uniref:aa3-type cytochrome oxidase subunit IV n=1 Tax=unclassified Brachybacterium TaxID=2623841 RepID=UPI00360B78DA
MRAVAQIFWILGVFILLSAIAYGFLTGAFQRWGVETAGFPALLAAAGLSFMIAMFASLTGRKHSLGASDDLDGEVAEEPGVQGSFSPYSWAPLWAAIGGGLCFLGVAAGWWIFAFGVLFGIYGVLSWVLEYSVGQHAH